jgi:hypothetical protein
VTHISLCHLSFNLRDEFLVLGFDATAETSQDVSLTVDDTLVEIPGDLSSYWVQV